MTPQEIEAYTIERSLDDGIERISYIPRQRRFETPLLLQHGMWHGAWCWQFWQELLAAWGWESHAISLPGHAGSPRQRRIGLCTLGYYLRFLQAAVARLPRKPILVGHSMGGAITQWYLKRVDDDLPAVVLAASWGAKGTFANGGLLPWIRLDPGGMLLAAISLSSQVFIRTPQRAAALLTSPSCVFSPEEFRARLTPESLLVMQQHNPPLWIPPDKVKAPMLWLAAEKDAAVTVESERKSAAHYGAEFVVIPESGHDIMLESSYRESVRVVHDWLVKQGIP